METLLYETESSELQSVTVLRGTVPSSPTYWEKINVKVHSSFPRPGGCSSIFLRSSTKIREKATWLHRSLTYLRKIVVVREPPHKIPAPNLNPIKISVQNILSRTLRGINHFSPVITVFLDKLIELTIPNNNFVTLSENINDQNACKKYWRQLTPLFPVVAQYADSLKMVLMEPIFPSSRTSSTH
jgi:hypothetical protein